MRAAVYARVSSAEQQARNTIASQLSTLPAYCVAQGWTVVATFVDDGRTAKAGHLEKREGLRQLLAAAKARVIDVVAVVDLDRLTRSEDLAERGAIYGALQAADVRIAVSSTGQLLDLRSQLGDLLAALGGVFAADENRKRAERIKRGKSRAVELGRKPAGPTPWGYVYERTTGAWSVDPQLGPVLVEMHQRVAAGETCEEIARDLARRGVPRSAPSKRGKRKPGHWNREWVWMLVSRRAYYHTGRWVADRVRRLEIAVPVIITPAMYEATQRQLARFKQRGRPKTLQPRLIGGLATCKFCKAPIVGSQVTNRRGEHVLYYVCSRRRRPDDKGRCALPMLRAAQVDAGVWRWVCKVMQVDGELERALQGYDGEDADFSLLERDLAAARARLRRLEQAEAAVLEQQRDGLITPAGVRRELLRSSGQIRFERAQIEGLETQRARHAQRADATAELASALEQLRAGLEDASYQERRALLELLVPGEGPYALRLGPHGGEASLRLTAAASALVDLARLQAAT